jgi:hypothetical protein
LYDWERGNRYWEALTARLIELKSPPTPEAREGEGE